MREDTIRPIAEKALSRLAAELDAGHSDVLKEYLAAHRIILEEQWKPDYVRSGDWPVRVAGDAEIDPSATLSGFYSIGTGCRVGAAVFLENTILWPGAQIASRAYLRNCIVRTQRKAQGEFRDTDI